MNVTRKLMQDRSTDVCKVVDLTRDCAKFLEEFKEKVLKRAITSAKELAHILEIEPKFPETERVRHVKQKFSYESQDDPISKRTPYKSSFSNHYLTFEQLGQNAASWGLLYNIQKLSQ
ncbi:hypothetical protein ILUMI_15685 [Ignelater luminosus]|uniref:Uncharacterized protein n=1 Tax=Ignelater luminosus TaxID=2038154 RepID=A0A8K0G9N8_IGNLU|nr:hypothetical protein ILUMI_15685 [Ignelater luminosus]